MMTKHFALLAGRSRSGDTAARKKLLMESYMRIAYQCRHILLNQSTAETITREILKNLHETLEELETPEEYLGRMQALIAKKTAVWLADADGGAQSQSAGKPIELPGKILDETQTAELVMRLVDDQPAEERLSLILRGCGEMENEAIAEGSGIDLREVEDSQARGSQAVNQRMDQYRQEGIKFLGLGNLDLMLMDAMIAGRNEMTAAAVAETVMGTIRLHRHSDKKSTAKKKKEKVKKEQEKPKNQKKTKKKRPMGLIILIVVLLLALLAAGAFALYLEKQHEDDWMLHEITEVTGSREV